MNLRLAYLCGVYPTATNTFIQREVSGLRDMGIHVETFSVRRPERIEQGGVEQESERRRTTYILPCSPWRLVRAHGRMLIGSPGSYLRGLWLAFTIRSPGLHALLYQLFYFLEAGVLAAQMRRRNLTHLHNHTPDASGYVAMLAAQIGQFTYSLTIHGFGILSEPNRWRLSDKLERSLFSICVSWNARSQAMLWSQPEHWDRFHVVHCGVNPDHYVPAANHGASHRLLYVGRLHYVKGLPLLLESIAILRERYPHIHLDIVGAGPEKARLEATLSRYGIEEHVTLHGYWSQAQLRERLSRYGIFVMASFAEGIPLVLMEAMAAGVPVIAPRVGGIPELIEDHVSGLLFHPGKVDDLVEKIELLMEDEQLWSQLHTRSRYTIEQEFHEGRELRRLVQILDARLFGRPVSIRPEACEADSPVNALAV